MVRKEIKNNLGFSLVEMLVAVFIFSIVMTTVISVYVKVFSTRQRAAAVQRNVEDMRYALEKIAKSVRNSELMSCINSVGGVISDVACGATVKKGIRVYDYSQQACIEYIDRAVNDGTGPKMRVQMRAKPLSVDQKDNCTLVEMGASPQAYFSNMTSGIVEGAFMATQSSSTNAGKVSVRLNICENCTPYLDRFNIQTTVSLRNDKEVNP